jgi:hypothetical protein
MLRRVALVRTDVSDEPSAYFIRVTRIDELGTTLAATNVPTTLLVQMYTVEEILHLWVREERSLNSYGLENVRTSTSQDVIGLHVLLETQLCLSPLPYARDSKTNYDVCSKFMTSHDVTLYSFCCSSDIHGIKHFKRSCWAGTLHG